MKLNLDPYNLPSHIAVIMDGNGRWAKGKGAARIFGHQNAIKAVRETTEACAELGIKYLTLYAFSTENWRRPADEVSGLMKLLVSTIKGELKTLLKNDVRLNTIGNISSLPGVAQQELRDAMAATSDNKGLTLTLALSYSGRSEILDAVQEIAKDIELGKLSSTDISSEVFEQYLETYQIPDPELLIRTSGEMRISNFLLWQIAYSELYMTETLWPDFRKEHLHEALVEYQKRERRFGKISEQVKN